MNKEKVKEVFAKSIVYADQNKVVGKLRAGDLHQQREAKKLVVINYSMDDWCNYLKIRRIE